MLKPGTQIAYVPRHIVQKMIDENTLHDYVDVATGKAKPKLKKLEGVEFGFVLKEATPLADGNPDGSIDYWCRYWLPGKLGTLRSVANSERTNEFLLSEIDTVDQEIVDALIAEIPNDKVS